MSKQTWDELLVTPDDSDNIWSVFHENSKFGRYSRPLDMREVTRKMALMLPSLRYDSRPAIALPPAKTQFGIDAAQLMLQRSSAENLKVKTLEMETLATILHMSYGDSRKNQDGRYTRPFRVIPSGGALYPLEVYVYAQTVSNLDIGLYHYDPSRHVLALVRAGDARDEIGKSLVQSQTAFQSSLLLFITGIPRRSTFKYGDRGYRFMLLEAGHLAQNTNLASTALGLASFNIGGFYDRELEQYLGIDGVHHSLLYMVGIGDLDEQGTRVLSV